MNSNFRKLSRRDFLKLATIGGVALAVPILHTEIGSTDYAQAYQKSVVSMGTTVTIRIEDDVRQTFAEFAAVKALDEINRLATILTRFPDGTQIYQLNQTGYLEAPSSEVLDVLRQAMGFSSVTEGDFDVTVEPVLALFQNYLGGGPFPSDSQFDSAKNLIDYNHVSITDHFLDFRNPGMGLTLDGIATGYILDRAVSSLRSSGIRSALVNVGGTIAVVGSRADGNPWEVGIADPFNPSSMLATLHLRDQAVATSGDYENYYTVDKRYYHIIDPSTARSPLYSHSATVVAKAALEADRMGVALMVAEPTKGVKLADSRGCECLLYTDSDGILTSTGMKDLVT